MAVLVDSSVWIAAAAARNKECLQLKRLINSNESIFVCNPIQTEVCQGARTEAHFYALWDSFLGFSFLKIEEMHWELCAKNYLRCRQRGLTLSTIDCLIATLAKEYEINLWTLDKNLRSSKRIIGFDTF